MRSKPDVDQIVRDATRLQTDRFSKRDAMLKTRNKERFNQTTVDVPTAYAKTSHQHPFSIISDEGQQIGTLVYAMPVPHIAPGVPEDQPLTTTEEKFLIAAHMEAEATFGPAWWQNTLAQVHDNCAWLYAGWRKVPYKGQPSAPADDAEPTAFADYAVKNDRYKRNQGVRGFLDYRYVPTNTMYWTGNVYDPDRVDEIKEVPERDLLDTYGVIKNADGSYAKRTEDPNTAPSGYQSGSSMGEKMVKIIERWDRKWCVIVTEDSKMARDLNGRYSGKAGFELTSWEHNWGRVPYFARPAFVTDQLAEEHRFAGPLDAVYTEMPSHRRLSVMADAVAYQTAFSPLQLVSKDSANEPIVDDNGNKMTFLELVPGKAVQLAPGQEIHTIPQSPEIRNLMAEKAASEQRIEHYSLSPVSKGVAPGADTANAALSNLHRFQLSTLDPLAQQASRQASAMYRFWLERIQEMNERVFVFATKTKTGPLSTLESDSYLSLGPEEVISVNVTAKVTPDQGQFALLLEKHAMELFLSGVGTEQSMYETMGKENPEEWVEASFVDKIRREQIMPVVGQQVVSLYGLTDAIKRMMMQNAQAGDGGAGAIPGIMADARQKQTGMGTGAPGQPRDQNAGVRTSVLDVNTQGAQAGGY